MHVDTHFSVFIDVFSTFILFSPLLRFLNLGQEPDADFVFVLVHGSCVAMILDNFASSAKCS